MEGHFDIAVIGAGIVGVATAYQLQKKRPDLRIIILEKEREVAVHQSDRNSGVIHSGIYYEPGSAKAINCTRGYRKLLAFCDENRVPYDLCGKVIVAQKPEQIPTLEKILSRGLQNQLQGLRLIEPAEIKEREPHVKAIKAIWVPQAGIIDYKSVTQKLLDIFLAKGGAIEFGLKVSAIDRKTDEVLVKSSDKEVVARHVVICAGLYSDKLAKISGLPVDFQIVPFRGEFYKLVKEREHLVNGLIYPVPDMKFPFLGVHFTKRIHGGIEAGPNAVLAFRREGYRHLDIHAGELWQALTYPGFINLARQHWRKGFDEMYRSFSSRAFLKNLQTLIPELEASDIERSRSGVRAQALDRKGNLINDYFIRGDERVTNLCNAPSPAATASLSIGEFLADKVLSKRDI